MSKHHSGISSHGSDHDGKWTVWNMMIIQFDIQVMNTILLWNKPDTIQSFVHFLNEAILVATRGRADAGV